MKYVWEVAAKSVTVACAMFSAIAAFAYGFLKLVDKARHA